MGYVVRPPSERRGSQNGPPHPERCVNEACGVLLIARGKWDRHIRPEGYRAHGSKGLCRSCHDRLRRYGSLIPRGFRQPPQPDRKGRSIEEWGRSRADVLDEYVMIRDDVQNIRQAAERMGMTFSALEKALYRARKDGDPRGNAPMSQIDRAISRGLKPCVAVR